MNETKFDDAEAIALGYNLKVVAHFRRLAPDVLSAIWNTPSDRFNGILNNTISNDLLWNAVLDADGNPDSGPKGAYYYSALMLLDFRGLLKAED